jgi:SAM-dependent methyltransferase
MSDPYLSILAAITRLYDDYKDRQVIATVSPGETMNNEWYWQVGDSAIRVVAAACVSANLANVRTVLDLPCGHGRVLRHLRAFFPHAEIHACDLDEAGVEFCADVLGAIPIVSQSRLDEVRFPARYDLIWVGSLFTHVSEAVASEMLTSLSGLLSERGIVVATFHGRWCEHVHKVAPYIGERRWERIVDGFRRSGYGYADYEATEGHKYIEGSYGVALARPSKLIDLVEKIGDVRIYSYTERAWADHQDVLVFGRPAYDHKWPGM